MKGSFEKDDELNETSMLVPLFYLFMDSSFWVNKRLYY